MAQVIDPAQRLATVSFKPSISPTLSLSNPAAKIELSLTLSITWAAPGHEAEPLTFCAWETIFEVHPVDFGGMDMFSRARSVFGLISQDRDPARPILLGRFYMHWERDQSADLREREGYDFVTVPSFESGSSVTLTHELSWERIFRYEPRLTKEDLVPGERFRLLISETKRVGTLWWCWGDIESEDLKNKRLHAWAQHDDDTIVPEGNWKLREDTRRIAFEKTSDTPLVFEIVE
ncbi:hypothetical protein F4801DRAFT_222739 [Xylaria longipes]|nr:hypothetical protein F4801DRAFT_222739 [Xylaria longipes]RYC57395.1 hypothetical protein CHU98_g8816 [Xylaria longipes]